MKRNLLTVSFFGLGLAASLASAQDMERPYLAADYMLLTYSNANSNFTDAEPEAVRLRAGSVIAKNLAVEAHLATGVKDGEATQVGNPANVVPIEVSTIYGAYVKPQIEAGPLTFFVLGGYGYYKYAAGPTNDVDLDGFSYGAGVQLNLGKNLGVSADFMQYADGLEAISAGIVYRL